MARLFWRGFSHLGCFCLSPRALPVNFQDNTPPIFFLVSFHLLEIRFFREKTISGTSRDLLASRAVTLFPVALCAYFRAETQTHTLSASLSSVIGDSLLSTPPF